MSGRGWTLGLALFAVVVGAIVAGAATARAGEAAPAEAPASEWELEVVPYAWITGNFGTVDVRGRMARVAVTPLDLLEAVFDGDAIGAAALARVRWRRWSLFVDAFGGGAKTDQRVTVPVARCDLDLEAKVRVIQAIVDVGIGGDVGRWAIAGRRRPVTLGAYAGMRYVHLGSQIDAFSEVRALGLERRTEASAGFDWADPLIGIRFEAPLLDRVSLDFRGDIGGFGVSSDLAWGLVGGVRYWMEWNPRGVRPWIGAGYRAVAFERSGDAEVDMQFRGPVSGVGLVF
jgi:hypothetical protein